MPLLDSMIQFLASVHPYDSLTDADLAVLAGNCEARESKPAETVFAFGDAVRSLFIIVAGEVEITDETGVQLSILGPRNSFGERALLREEAASRTATATADTTLIVMPDKTFFGLIDAYPTVAKFFDRRRPPRSERKDLTTMRIERLMTRDPMTCAPDTPIRQAAEAMHHAGISSICIADDDAFRGIVTLRDR